jgi:CheY-like chemotaxis protein
VTRITVVNDNPEFLALMRDILEDDRYVTVTVDGDQPDALERIRASRPDLLIIDLRLGTDGVHGWDIAQEVRRDPGLDALPVLVLSGDVATLREIEEDLAATQHTAGMAKPFGIDELERTIQRLLAEAAA